MRRKTKKALKLSAHHAGIALQMLLEEGKIVASDVTRALSNREKMIKELRERLAALETAARPVARRVASSARRAARRAAPRARKAITRAQRVARQAQGRYMAAVRRLSQDARVRIREIRKQSGVDAAIKAAMKMAGAK
ncbi:MAG TPA: hypothetical protein VLU06_01020 [Thermoanaerobaculia bacterium]|nr:hypothetical protein [Thermoanaerobaculia bacterium]